jgi:predicted  nucleic acid-binding Zn-ribbon protein
MRRIALLVFVLLLTACGDVETQRQQAQAEVERARAAQVEAQSKAQAAQAEADSRARQAEAQAQAEVERAKAQQTLADAQLTNSQTFSSAMGAQTSQIAELVNTIIAQAQMMQWVVVLLAAGLVLLCAGGLVIAALYARRKPAPTVIYQIAPSPAASLIDSPDEWPERRARHRALLATRSEVRRE